MAGERSARMQSIVNRAAARQARRLALVADAFHKDPDPLTDTFEAAFLRADEHGHTYGASCNDPYCQKLSLALQPFLQQMSVQMQGGGAM